MRWRALLLIVTAACAADGAPIGGTDLIGVLAGDSVAITFVDLLANDSDPTGDPLSVGVADTSELVGSLVRETDRFVYAASGFESLPQGIAGKTSFTYALRDGQNFVATRVDVVVLGLNDHPHAENDFEVVNEGTTLVIPVLANDSDPDDGEVLTVQSVTQPESGTVVTDGHVLSFTPTGGAIETLLRGATAEVSFSYTVADAHGATATANVVVTVTGDGIPPIAVTDHYYVTNLVPVLFFAADLIANDLEGSEGPIHFLDVPRVAGPHGQPGTIPPSFSLYGDGVFAFDPRSTFTWLTLGETYDDGISYRITDGTFTVGASVIFHVIGAAATSSGDGDDYVLFASGTLDGGAGDDTLSGVNQASIVVDLDACVAVGATLVSSDGACSFEHLLGSPGDDTLSGDDRDNIIFADKGNDRVYLSGGLDFLDGGKETYDLDVLDGSRLPDGFELRGGRVESGGAFIGYAFDFEKVVGSPFDDVLIGPSHIQPNAGNDAIACGGYLYNGYTRIDLTNATAALEVNCQTGAITGFGTKTFDPASCRELLGATEYPNVFIGDSNQHVFYGGTADDVFIGSGLDVLSYSHLTGPIIATLPEGGATGAGTDTFTGIWEFIGTSASDTFILNGEGYTVAAGQGDDLVIVNYPQPSGHQINGEGGVDRLRFPTTVTVDLVTYGDPFSYFEIIEFQASNSSLQFGHDGCMRISGESGTLEIQADAAATGVSLTLAPAISSAWLDAGPVILSNDLSGNLYTIDDCSVAVQSDIAVMIP